MTRVLFLCGMARMRSPTAADITRAHWGHETDFAGLSNDADEKLSSEQLEWADLVFVMERRQLKRVKALFGPVLGARKLRCLDIRDRYGFMDADLVALLTARLKPFLGAPR